MTNSKQKGNRGEREVAGLLVPLFPNARRRVVAEEAQRVGLGRDIDGVPGYCIQVQLAKRPTPEKKFNEAVAASKDGEVPVAFTRRSSKDDKGAPWLVTLRASDLIHILEQHQRAVDWLTREEKTS